MAVLIPALRPGPALVEVVRGLRRARPALDVVVVDDGSGPAYDFVFSSAARLGARVVRLPRNRGKGGALKAGVAWIAEHRPGEPVVCADADGQHAVADILAVVDRSSRTEAMVLGTRSLDSGVPARSRLGNSVTRWLFGAATGRRVEDTQTGLRGYPAALLPWLLTVEGERYEYELNLLLAASRHDVAFETVPIATIYLDGNDSSHFRPVRDSIRIYRPLLAFLLSSVSAFVLDTAVLLVLDRLVGSLLLAVVGARLVSATVNFLVNRHLVFHRGTTAPPPVEARRYVVLASTLLVTGYLVLRGLSSTGLPLLPAKVATELLLLGVSYTAQRTLVFRRPPEAGPPPRRESDLSVV